MTSTYQNIQNELRQNPRQWLVTGVAGFIGSSLLQKLLELGQTVVGLDNFSTGYQHNLDEVRDQVGAKAWANFRFIKGDLADEKTCLESAQGAHVILHQGALGSVPRSLDNPLATNTANVTGTLNIFWAAKQLKIPRVVYAASSSTYGDHPGLPKVEDRIGRPLSPYAVTKYVNELYAQVFADAYQMQIIGLRYFNVFGRRQDPDGAYAAVIPKWIAALIKNEDIFVNGDGETSRDFTYIDNVVQLNLLAGAAQNSAAVNQVYNGAIGDRTTLNQLYKFLTDLLKDHIPGIENKKPIYRDFRAGDVLHSQADITKAKSLLGYEPSHTVLKGLTESIEWYRKNLN